MLWSMRLISQYKLRLPKMSTSLSFADAVVCRRVSVECRVRACGVHEECTRVLVHVLCMCSRLAARRSARPPRAAASSGGSLGGAVSEDEERLEDAHPHAEQPAHGDELPLVLLEDGMQHPLELRARQRLPRGMATGCHGSARGAWP